MLGLADPLNYNEVVLILTSVATSLQLLVCISGSQAEIKCINSTQRRQTFTFKGLAGKCRIYGCSSLHCDIEERGWTRQWTWCSRSLRSGLQSSFWKRITATHWERTRGSGCIILPLVVIFGTQLFDVRPVEGLSLYGTLWSLSI